MFKTSYQRPRLRIISLAGIVFAGFLVLLVALPEAVKWVGAPFLDLPSRLGLIQQITRAEVHIVNGEGSRTLLELTQPGRYAVFSSDLRLLDRAEALLAVHEQPWLAVRSRATGEPVRVAFVERGLRPYDSPLVKGRPVFMFTIVKPGAYELAYPFGNAAFAIVPDYTTGHETLLMLAYTLQMIAIVACLGLFASSRNRRYYVPPKQSAAASEQRRLQADAFWQTELQRNKERQEQQRTD